MSRLASVRSSHCMDMHVGLIIPLAWAISSRAKKIIKMNYTNFDTSIVQAYRCKIIGWVGKFVNPSEIGTIEQLRTLRDVWASGSARWVRLSPTQVKAHMAEVNEQIERGDVTIKVRSDAPMQASLAGANGSPATKRMINVPRKRSNVPGCSSSQRAMQPLPRMTRTKARMSWMRSFKKVIAAGFRKF